MTTANIKSDNFWELLDIYKLFCSLYISEGEVQSPFGCSDSASILPWHPAKYDDGHIFVSARQGMRWFIIGAVEQLKCVWPLWMSYDTVEKHDCTDAVRL